jgi:acetyl-CoA carboxylase biotin carboxyl carrier protein
VPIQTGSKPSCAFKPNQPNLKMPKTEDSPTPPELPERSQEKSEVEIPLPNSEKAAAPGVSLPSSSEDDFSNSPVDVKLVKHLISLFQESDLGEFEVSQGDFLIRLGKAGCAPATIQMPQFAAAPALAPGGQTSSPTIPEEDPNHIYIKAPMVGTFYRSPSPEADTFVEIGQKVQEKTTVCIIEAMKVMNELPAECAGTIVDILVENGNGVEYGQPLFKVAKN